MKLFLRSNFRLIFARLCLCAGFAIFLASCGGRASGNENVLTVSIEPLRFLIEEIVGDDFRVDVLAPPGASPETYEPTPLQMKSMEDARLVFSTGLIGFETVLLGKFPFPERLVDLSVGIDLIATQHDHDHDHNHNGNAGHSHSHGGVDPHIWVSPKALARMARTAYSEIHEQYPDSASYTVNYTQLAERLTMLDKEISDRIATSPARSFMIFHPGLTYYARDYELRQIALESDGKEPSAKQLAETIALARAENITKVLYQSEFPRRIVEVAAAEIGAEPVEIDILGYDIIDNILKITNIIAEPVDSASSIPTKL